MIRTLLPVFAFALLATAAAAQGKKNANAKATPAATNEIKPVTPQAPASRGWAMQAGVYGGYSLALLNSATTTTTSNGASIETKTTSTTDLGGLYGGADFLLGQRFQYGLGIAYMQTLKASGASAALVPITLRARYTLIPKIYVGLNAGYAFFVGQKSEGYSYLDIPLGAEAGYQFNLGAVFLDAGLQMTYTIASRKATDVVISGGTFFLTPYVRLSYSF
jgi:hypothetical protein